MDFAAVIRLLLSASVMMIVFSLGLQATLRDATYLLREPRRLVCSLLAMAIVMPALAGVLAYALVLPPAVEIALIVLSVSPVPPILPRKELAAGGNRSFALGLHVAAAIASILFIPAAVEVFGRIFHVSVHMSAGSIARIVTVTILAPLSAGLAVRQAAPRLAQWFAEPVSRVATLLLTVAVLAIVFFQRSEELSLIGNGTLLVIILFVTVGCLTGAWLGGPEPGHRTVLALSTATRHPGVAMAIASANFPDQKLVLPAILLYLIVGGIVSWVFLKWQSRRNAEREAEHPRRQSPAA